MGRILTRKAINKTFTDCSKVDSSLALRVSCLNFEPRSQSFPVILAKMANITISIITSLFYCFTFLSYKNNEIVSKQAYKSIILKNIYNLIYEKF